MNKKVKTIVYTAITAAALCILAPMSIPLPFTPIPISLTILVLCLSCYLTNYKITLIAYSTYVVLGMVGLPVFSGFTGGIGKIAGPTGGYILGFYAVIFLCGICVERFNGPVNQYVMPIVGMLAGIAIDYILGTAWYVFSQNVSITAALTACVIPFIPFDCIKIAVCALVGQPVRHLLKNKRFRNL